jgi:hypothetical protein
MSSETTDIEPTASALFDALDAEIVAIEPDTPMDVAAAMRLRVVSILRMAQQAKSKLDEYLIPLVERQGPITVGTEVTAVVESEKHVKCHDLRAALEALITKSGGDWDLFTTTLSVNAIKPSEAKKLLGDDLFAEHFDVTWRKVLKDGQPSKKLITQDMKFVK